ncbi:hypothetical protein PV08_09301 [Exophiala spinifera]|uniref:Uncharacterized protein n=1 Tax=Exophiala spinifera TaxID=91928 RepID=A0A0D1ZGE3_9EURO|nr:uncharacterized protein PV08_09301 [Exophiala spinifera]KIW12027.1 hypothetical protein PV08_09301 [Exophiala spinifera]
MAQATQPLLYICRSCRQSLQNGSLFSRSFSTTRVQQKVIPSFQPTGHGELDQLLLSFREKVFTPAALEPQHRKLLYKPSKHEALVAEPGVTVTMSDGEEIRLRPMDPFDRPSVKQSVRTIAKVFSEEKADVVWNNLAPWLNGMRMSRMPLPGFFWAKITRKACEIGKERFILSCIDRSEDTNFTLRKQGVTYELMLGFHKRAADHGFAGPELASAWNRAQKVVRMLDDELSGGYKLKPDEVDPRKDPLVLSVLTELAAATALESGGDPATVVDYARKMLFLAQQEKPSIPGLEQHREDVRARAESNHILENLLPLQNAISLALQIDAIKASELGQQLESHLRVVEPKVKETVQKLREVSDGQKRRGELMYEQLAGQEGGEASEES